MVGLMKSALRNAVGHANVTYKQFKEVLITVEVTLPHIWRMTELPPLTPNGLIHGMNISLPEENTEALDEETKLSPYARYIKRCKDIVWKRWSCEYVKALRAKHRISLGKAAEISTGDIYHAYQRRGEGQGTLENGCCGEAYQRPRWSDKRCQTKNWKGNH